MAKLTNPGLAPVALPTGHVVPRKGSLETTNDVLRCADNAAFLNGQILSGQLSVEYDPDPGPPPEAETSIVEAPGPTGAATPPEQPEKGKAKGA